MYYMQQKLMFWWHFDSSFCEEHRPRQSAPSSDRLAFHGTAQTTCAICMNAVEARASNNTLRTPCCKSAWYHRECIQVSQNSSLHKPILLISGSWHHGPVNFCIFSGPKPYFSDPTYISLLHQSCVSKIYPVSGLIKVDFFGDFMLFYEICLAVWH